MHENGITRRDLIRLFGAGTAVLTLEACTRPVGGAIATARPNERPTRGGVLLVGTRNEPTESDPQANSATVHAWPQSSLYAKLIHLGYPDETGFRGELAERWEVSPDFSRYTFYLHKDAKWHDGTPITARDVEYMVKRGANPTPPNISQDRSLYSEITPEVLDDHTIRFALNRPRFNFLYDFATKSTWLAHPRHLFDGNEPIKPDKTGYVGSGPFKFKEFRRGSFFEIVRNPDYWLKDEFGDSLPYLDGIRYQVTNDAEIHLQLLRVGQIQLTAPGSGWWITPSQKQVLDTQYGGTVKYTTNRSTNTVIVVNPNSLEPFKDVRVRKAVQLWIDRPSAVQALDEGAGEVSGFFPFNSPMGQIDWSKQPGFRKEKEADRAEAKKLMQDAGYGSGFSATILQSVLWTRLGEYYVSDLKGLGIDLQLDIVDQPTAQARFSQDRYQLYMFQYTNHVMPEDMNPQIRTTLDRGLLRGWKGTPEGKEIDDLLDRALASLDAKERAALAKEADEYVHLKGYLAWPLEMIYASQAYLDGVRGIRFTADRPVFPDQTFTWLAK